MTPHALDLATALRGDAGAADRTGSTSDASIFGEELAAHGNAPLAATADAKVFHRRFGDQWVELWSESGTLLATGVQMACFRV